MKKLFLGLLLFIVGFTLIACSKTELKPVEEDPVQEELPPIEEEVPPIEEELPPVEEEVDLYVMLGDTNKVETTFTFDTTELTTITISALNTTEGDVKRGNLFVSKAVADGVELGFGETEYATWQDKKEISEGIFTLKDFQIRLGGNGLGVRAKHIDFDGADEGLMTIDVSDINELVLTLKTSAHINPADLKLTIDLIK